MAISADRTELYAGEWTASQTDTELIAAPAAGYYIKVFDVIMSSSGAGTVLLEQGSSTRFLGRVTVAADGGLTHSSEHGLDVQTAATSITLTSTTGAAVLSITIGYVVLKAL